MEDEVWKEIKEFPKYEISNKGRVRSFWDRWGKSKPKILSLTTSTIGYKTIGLHRKTGVTKTVYVHRLIAKAFIPNPENKKCINHKDGNKTNNSITNLEWVTKAENNRHAARTGLNDCKGENHWRSKLTKDEVLEIRDLYSNGAEITSLADMFNVAYISIWRIVNNKNWTHI